MVQQSFQAWPTSFSINSLQNQYFYWGFSSFHLDNRKVNKLCQSLFAKLEQKVVIRTGLFKMTMLTSLVVVYISSLRLTFSLFHHKVTIICCTQV